MNPKTDVALLFCDFKNAQQVERDVDKFGTVAVEVAHRVSGFKDADAVKGACERLGIKGEPCEVIKDSRVKYSDSIKEKARVLLSKNVTYKEVEEKTGINYSIVARIKRSINKNKTK